MIFYFDWSCRIEYIIRWQQ